MRINIRAHHYEMNDAIQEFIEKKLTALTKYLDDIKDAYVELTMDTHHKKGDVAQTEVILHLLSDSDVIIRADASSDDFHSSVDLVVDKLKSQIKDYKERRRLVEKDTIREAKGK